MTAHAPIPDSAFREAVAVLGRTGSGKTFAAKGVVELMLERGDRVCIVDPTGVWYGLKSSADGKSPGFPVAVFGGMHADVPLAEDSAAPLAELLATRNLPAVIDVAEFSRDLEERLRARLGGEVCQCNDAQLAQPCKCVRAGILWRAHKPGHDQGITVRSWRCRVRVQLRSSIRRLGVPLALLEGGNAEMWSGKATTCC